MDIELQGIGRAALVGIGATALLDLWLAALARAGVPTGNFDLVGRWVGHGLRGKWLHRPIAKSAPIPRERALGWTVHYATGIAFAVPLVAMAGPAWLAAPTVVPALAWGLATVSAPLFVMQPAMGAGFAASRTPTPVRNVIRSIANHTVFGLGLYLAATALTLKGLP